jgi:hypothetical protein
MSEQPTEPGRYELRIGGHLDDRWAERFGNLTLTRETDGTTTLRGPVIDQAALHSLLITVRDLGMTLISVHAIGDDPHSVRPPTGQSSITTPVTTCGDDASPTASVAFVSSPSASARVNPPMRSAQ